MKRHRNTSSDISEPYRKKLLLDVNDALSQQSFSFPTDSGISKPISDRSSRFQAFFLPLSNVSQADKVLSAFKRSTYCDKADHVMTAYRFPQDNGSSKSHHDDDGERFSGVKLGALLENLNAWGLIICVREYGGIMLGPIRFQHITLCAREAIMAYRHQKSLAVKEAEKTTRLLHARDLTISSLRSVLGHQGTTLPSSQHDNTGATSADSSKQTQVTKLYSGLDQETLNRLLTARDKTIKSLRALLQPTET